VLKDFGKDLRTVGLARAEDGEDLLDWLGLRMRRTYCALGMWRTPNEEPR
jgi:hypothetical protein